MEIVRIVQEVEHSACAVDVCEVHGKMARITEFIQDTWLIKYEPRWRLLSLCFAFVEFSDMIKDHNEFILDLRKMVSILIGLEHHLYDVSAIMIGFKL